MFDSMVAEKKGLGGRYKELVRGSGRAVSREVYCRRREISGEDRTIKDCFEIPHGW